MTFVRPLSALDMQYSLLALLGRIDSCTQHGHGIINHYCKLNTLIHTVSNQKPLEVNTAALLRTSEAYAILLHTHSLTGARAPPFLDA